MVVVFWTRLALNDLRSIHRYISKDSKFYADRYINKIMARADQLKAFPKSGRIVPEFNTEYIRELIEGNYRIVCEVNSLEKVTIIRVHHSARLLK